MSKVGMSASKKKVTFGLRHKEWDNCEAKFISSPPEKPPVIKLTARLMNEVHQNFGVKCEAVDQSLLAVADTGCQTSSAGIDVLKAMGLKKRHLIPTCHRIIGITDTQLRILGAMFIEFEHNGKFSKQMVYVSENSSGLYLSKTALVQLGIIDQNFPCDKTTSTDVKASTAKAIQEDDEDCLCLPRGEPPNRPDKIPFEPVEENIPKIKNWLIEQFASSAFNTCSHQPLKQMTGEPMNIAFKDNYVPHCVNTPIEVPHYWKRKVKADLDRDVRLQIIEPVPQGTPSVWCARAVWTAKKNGDPRRVVDQQKLNGATLRETHFTPSPYKVVSVTPSNTFKTVLDAWNGYHSLPLSEDSRDATTFITEWGRYRYCRAPQGFHASGDAYTRRFDDITSGFERVSRIIDDSLLWDNTIEDAFWHTFDYIHHCCSNGVVFNQEKFRFAEKEVEFAGFEMTADGYRPPKSMIESIRNFPTPKSITDIRSWFGAINQVSYAFSQSKTMAPFRELLSTKNKKFYWDDSLNRLFEESKIKIIEQIKDGVKNFEINRPTCLSTDWSKSGIGFTLTQKHCECPVNKELGTFSPNCGNGHWRLILAGSRFTKESESRYAPIEGEALAVAYGLNQCRMFVLGSPDLLVAVDHKPLTKILNDRSLDNIENPRLLRLKEKTLQFEYKIIHIPGSSNTTADMMSRYPNPSAPMALSIDEKQSCAHAAAQLPPDMNSVSWHDINNASLVDEECLLLRETLLSGFPDKKDQVNEKIRQFWPMREDLYVIENSIFRGRRVLVPAKFRKVVIEGLHAAHQGVAAMQMNARERFFWPGIDTDLKNRRNQCNRCNEIAPSQPDEPMILTQDPDLPYEQVAVDFFTMNGSQLIVYADRLSGWVEVAKVSSTAFPVVRKLMLKWFQTFGVPKEISSDGGPPFNSHDYNEFLKQWGIKKRISSAHYPQSNGRAEAAVKSMKRCIGDCGSDDDMMTRAIMMHRNTPNRETKISPAEMLFGIKLRDHLPNKFRPLRKEWRQIQKSVELHNAAKNQQMEESNNSRRTLLPLDLGDRVSIQNQHGNKPRLWSNTGTIVEVLPDRQYRLLIDGSRRLTLRNRKFLRKINQQTPRNNVVVNNVAIPTLPNPVIDEKNLISRSENKTTAPISEVQLPRSTESSEHAPDMIEINSPNNKETASIPTTPVQGLPTVLPQRTPATQTQKSPTQENRCQQEPSNGTVEPRRSKRSVKKPKRLIEEMR